MSESPSKKGKTSKSKMSARKKARQLAMQAIYQWQVTKDGATTIEAQFLADNDASQFDTTYFKQLLHGIIGKIEELDHEIGPLLDRSLKEITPVELAILRLSAFELAHMVDVPYRVVINEGIELAKKFGSTDGHKFVNGVLDRLSKRLRSQEFSESKT